MHLYRLEMNEDKSGAFAYHVSDIPVNTTAALTDLYTKGAQISEVYGERGSLGFFVESKTDVADGTPIRIYGHPQW